MKPERSAPQPEQTRWLQAATSFRLQTGGQLFSGLRLWANEIPVTWILTLFALLPFYLLGAFPSGRLIALSRGVRIDEVGSGNVGATNVARTLGKRAGVYTLALDLGKGALAAALAGLLFGGSFYTGLAAVAAVAGHCFSIPGKLKGGKGVATAFGALIVINAGAALFSLGVFVAVAAASRIVSVASITAAGLAPLYLLILGAPEPHFYAWAAIAALVILRHRENLKRLIEGREPKLGASRSKSEVVPGK